MVRENWMEKSPGTKVEDKERRILAKLREREPSALDEIYDLYGNRLYHYLLSLLRSEDEAEDVLQNLFLKLARSANLAIENLGAYMFTSARNEAMRLVEKRNRREKREADLRELVILESMRRDKKSVEEAEKLNIALSKLPPEQMESVVLKVYEGLTYREIGEAIGIPLDTARNRYKYGIEKLRVLLGRERISGGS